MSRPPEVTPVEQRRWSPREFERYLARLGQDPDGEVLPVSEYPFGIDPGFRTQYLFDEMRDHIVTSRRERWAPVCFDATMVRLDDDTSRGDIIIPSWSVEGDEHRISQLTRTEEIKSMLGSLMPTHIIGHHHSHPASYRGRRNDGKTAFSEGDLYNMVAPFNREFFQFAIAGGRIVLPIDMRNMMMGVVSENDQLLVFRARESGYWSTHIFVPGKNDQELFIENWHNRAVQEMQGNPSQPQNLDPVAVAQRANLMIAEAYNLVLYRGNPKGELTRIYPA